MKALPLILGVVAVVGIGAPTWARENENLKVGGTTFAGYEGHQDWPTSESTTVIKDYTVPIYFGLPPKAYKVLGRIYDERTKGFDAVGRAFDEGLDSEKHRQRDCANQARLHGADAVVVTDDPKVVKAFNLTPEEIRKTAPLFQNKDKIVVAIKFK